MSREKIVLEFDMNVREEACVYAYLAAHGVRKELELVKVLLNAKEINPRIMFVPKLTPLSELVNAPLDFSEEIGERPLVLNFNINDPIERAVYLLLAQTEDEGKTLVKNAIIATHLKK